MIRPPRIRKQYVPLCQTQTAWPNSLADWLGERELAELETITHSLRRTQWLVGRWIGKHLLSQLPHVSLSSHLQILTRDERGMGARPRVVWGRDDLGLSLSIAHSDQGVMVAIAGSRFATVGVDLVDACLSVDEGFCRMWFSSRERQWLEHDQPRRAALLWGIKEAVYKAANSGHAWSPRDVEVTPRCGSQFAVSYRGRELRSVEIEIDEHQHELAIIASMARSISERSSTGDASARPAGTGGRSRSPGPASRFVTGSVRGSHVR